MLTALRLVERQDVTARNVYDRTMTVGRTLPGQRDEARSERGPASRSNGSGGPWLAQMSDTGAVSRPHGRKEALVTAAPCCCWSLRRLFARTPQDEPGGAREENGRNDHFATFPLVRVWCKLQAPEHVEVACTYAAAVPRSSRCFTKYCSLKTTVRNVASWLTRETRMWKTSRKVFAPRWRPPSR